MCRYQGYIGAALVLGGVDCNGPHLYSIYPHGSTDKLPYVTMGESLIHFLLNTSCWRDPETEMVLFILFTAPQNTLERGNSLLCTLLL